MGARSRDIKGMQDPENNHRDYGIEQSFDRDDGIPVMYQALVLQKTEKPLNTESIYNFYQSLFS